MATALDLEVYRCRDCLLWNDGQGFEEGKEFQVWWVHNGMSLNLGNGLGSIPFSSEVVPCPLHLVKLEQLN